MSRSRVMRGIRQTMDRQIGGKPPRGGVSFAGAHTAYIVRGFTEGGAKSGQRAAAEVLAIIA